ncbi:MAG: ACP S-malonyltransferase [Bacteroidales bacterium]|nr:ACP S-malonyltransferase [Bacteroidales bacterium]
MKKAYIFPGQGSQYCGMGKDLYESNQLARDYFERANEILGYRITETMFNGSEEELRQTKITQPAIFLHSVILAFIANGKFTPDMVAGHSLGEFSALVAAKAISFEDGLKLVYSRAMAMQKACEATPSTMAAILGVDDNVVAEVCYSIKDDIVCPANYNSPGQIVISGTVTGVEKAIAELQKKGAKRAIKLNVSGAFHSPLMESARKELSEAINNTKFNEPICPIYQNVTALPEVNPEKIKENLILQLTAPVKWTQTIQNMIKDGATTFIEVGPGQVLQNLVKKIDKNLEVFSLQL